MKRFLSIVITFILTNSFITSAQSWEWAYTIGSTPRSQAVAIKEDLTSNYYFASFTDSVTTRVSTQMEKRDANQQLLWQKQITGNATITDLEINAANHVIVTGYFEGTISIDGNSLTSVTPADNSAFIFEADESGMIQWVHDINPIGGNFKAQDLFIDWNGSMYLTSEVSGTFGFCAFHKLDPLGNITKNEFNNNFENRTYSHILTDNDGNVYISGTCGNGANFDTINANPSFSYQNFLVKYDSSFNAQWLITKNYVTFDDNNGLSTDGQNLYWAFNEFNGNADTVKIIETDFNGVVINSMDGPLASAFFPSLAFTTDQSGNSVLLLNVYARIYLYRYDAAFNLVWQDTINSYTSGFPLRCGLACYDSSFYLASYYTNDTLMFDNIMLLNPNVGTNYPSDLFVAKWSNNQLPTSLNSINEKNNSFIIYPNPVSDEFTINGWQFTVGDEIKIYDVMGKEVESLTVESLKLQMHVNNLNNGLYFLKVIAEDNRIIGSPKLVIMR